MENVTAIDNPRRPSRSLRPREPLYPCTEVAERFWDQCYDWQITYALYVNDSDFAKVFALCAASVPGGARGRATAGLGGDALQQSKFVTSRPARSGDDRGGCARSGPTARRATAASTGAVRNMYRDYVDGDVQARALCRVAARARGAARARACAPRRGRGAGRAAGGGRG